MNPVLLKLAKQRGGVDRGGARGRAALCGPACSTTACLGGAWPIQSNVPAGRDFLQLGS